MSIVIVSLYLSMSLYSKAGISEIFEGHQGPVTGIDCHKVPGQIDFSPYFVTSSFDWTIKLWSIKVGWPGPKVIKQILFSAQLSMKFVMLINVNMPTIIGILTFISMINILLKIW